MRAPFRFVAIPSGVLVLSVFVASLHAQQPAGKVSTRPTQPQAAPPKTAPSQTAPPKGGLAPKTNPIKQAGGQAEEGNRPARPAAPELVVEKLSPELEAILVEWERRSAQIKSLRGKHARTVFNKVFELEKRAEGKFFLETPDKGRIDLVGSKIEKGEKSAQIGESGKPFRIESDRSEKWICNGEEIVMVNDEDKSYEVAPLPKELRGTNIVNGPLPFLFGIKADEAKRRFKLSLSEKNPDPTVHSILVVPRLPDDKQNYKIAKINLDKKTFLPRSVMLLDPSGNLQTRYDFEIQDVNNRNKLIPIADWFGGDRDPYRPELIKKGYKLAIHEDQANPRGITPTNATSRPGVAKPSRPSGNDKPLPDTREVSRPGTSLLGPPRK